MQAQIVFVLITLLKTVLSADAETSEYVIPLSINPIVQHPIELSGMSGNFYNQDPDFYSSVTLTDVSHDTRQDLKEIVPKKLSVIFFTVVSSYIGGTLKKSDLKYLSRNRWSYSITVVELIAASEGNITKLDQELELYVFQELGMKFLERRYNFSMNVIQNDLGLSLMEFFGASEEQWIKIVGFITEQMINRRSEELSLTPCYLAELLNKTLNDALAFTLNEVDEYIYNISSLQEKLPQFQETILATTFNVTSADIAILSGLNITVINSLGLRNQIKHLTKSILDKFHLSTDEISTKYKRSRDDILIPCVDEWKWFQTLVVQEAFEKQATNMSLANKTLASLIQIPYPNISKLSLDEIEHLIDTTIREVKGRKDTIEQKKLNMLIGTGNQSYLINLEETTFSVIEAVTNFSKSELTLIYGWGDSHYLFAKIFSVADLIHSCSSELHNYTLLELARINAGEDNDMCTTFSALRNIWEKATINHLEKRFGSHFSNFTIESILLSLTGGNLTFINRVLNLSADARALCANVTLDHISIATSRPIMHIKQMSFQNIINLAEELKANGTLFPMRVVSYPYILFSKLLICLLILQKLLRKLKHELM